MRNLGLALTGLLTCVTAAAAQQQQPPAPATQAPAADRARLLDKHLQGWEEQMKKISTLHMPGIKRVDKDNQLKYVSTWIGEAKYNKPNLAMLYLVREDKREIWERWVCSGAAIYQFQPQQKQIVLHQLPAKKEGQVSDENFLSFMFGMKAEDAKKRYVLQISASKENDPYYVYIDIQPREGRDKADFEKARLVLNKDTYLPRQLWFKHPNGDETTWDIPQAKSGVNLDRRDFQQPTLPKDWKLVRNELGDDKAPRIIRQKQP